MRGYVKCMRWGRGRFGGREVEVDGGSGSGRLRLVIMVIVGAFVVSLLLQLLHLWRLFEGGGDSR
jgi:hypothetical protein